MTAGDAEPLCVSTRYNSRLSRFLACHSSCDTVGTDVTDRPGRDDLHDQSAHLSGDCSEHQFPSLIEAALAGLHTPIAITELSRGRVHASQALLDLLGLSQASLAADGLASLEAAEAQLIEHPPEPRQYASRPLEREHRDLLQFHDGRRFERVIAPYGRDGAPAGQVITYRDLAVPVASEQLATGHVMLERAQQVAHIGSWVNDHLTGRLEWTAESRRIFGLEDHAFPRTVDELLQRVHADDRDAFRAAYQRLQERGSYDVEHRLLRPDGEVIWVHQRADVERDANGRRLRTIGTIQDVTGRRRLEEQLRQAQKLEAIGQLAGGVAHDLNNALTSIVGYTELAIAAMKTDHPATPDVVEIRRAAERAESVTRQLLAFSRKQPLSPRVFALSDVVTGLSRMLQRFLGSRTELVIDTAADVAPICGDPGQLEQAIVNLAVNAKDAMPDGGGLRVRLSMTSLDSGLDSEHDPIPPGRYVELAMRDSGTGMTPDVLAHIFEPFFTTKEPGKGTGLGLAMVYGTVKQIGGYIAVESAAGEGTTFRLLFPPAKDPARRRVSGTRTAPAIVSGEPTIVIVEDETPVRNLVILSLSNRGYRLVSAESGTQALEAIEREGAIDLLLTDANMPGMSGIDLVRQVLGRHRELRAIVMSGFTEDLPRLEEIEDRVSLLPKPFTPRELRERVDRMFGK